MYSYFPVPYAKIFAQCWITARKDGFQIFDTIRVLSFTVSVHCQIENVIRIIFCKWYELDTFVIL